MLAKALLSLSVLLICGGSGSAQEKAAEPIVVVAKHARTRGPCITIGEVRVMPLIDEFEIQRVAAGRVPRSLKSIQVRALSGNVEQAKEGELYRLTLTPSASTTSQLQDRAKDGYSWVWVDARELKLQKPK